MEPIYSGKVREIYDIGDDHLVIVTTDRISAFDHILPVLVPDKGVVLNQLANFWFDRTRQIIPNHIISTDLSDMPAFFQREDFQGRTVLVKKLRMLPFEFVVRGYMFGSMWKAYEAGEPFCGQLLQGDYQQAQALERPLLTPAVKRDKGHDEYVGMDAVRAGLGAETAERIANICLKLYDTCRSHALSRGIIIADAKFEFGLDGDGQLVLADEIFTPDSSRFWDAADYRPGVSPRSYDKQFLRDWLLANAEGGELPFDRVPEEIIRKTKDIYQECLRRLVN